MDNPSKNKTRALRLIIFIFIFLSGIFLGLYLKGSQNVQANPEDEQHKGITGQYKFINPLLQCNSDENREFQNFEYKIDELISASKRANKIIDAAVYFRDMDTGQWLGINQGSDFSPASLLKVPFMIALFKQTETQPTLLADKISYGQNVQLNSQNPAVQNITDNNTIQKGKEYTVEELINFMILHSDNAAKDLLGQQPRIEALIRGPYEDLGIDISGVKGPEDFMTVKEYASFFRILYNSSYLSEEMSNKALELLSQTSFNSGLVAGIPRDIVVSHKFGERGYMGLQQLHDCGIVYAPQRPYMLCIMTRGHNIKSLEETISNISELVYREVKTQSVKK